MERADLVDNKREYKMSESSLTGLDRSASGESRRTASRASEDKRQLSNTPQRLYITEY